MSSGFWKCKDGRILRISEMDTDHLVNAIAYCKRRAERIAAATEREAGNFAGQDGAYFDGADAAGVFLSQIVPFDDLCNELEYRKSSNSVRLAAECRNGVGI